MGIRCWLAVAMAACGASHAPHAAGRQPEWAYSWRPDLGFADNGPTCLLNPPDDIAPSDIYLAFYWSARQGPVLWLDWRSSETPAVRVESEGTLESWAIAMELPDPKRLGRRVFLDSRADDGILRSLELGHALSVVVSLENGESKRFHVPARGAQIGVPMYRACIKSVTDDPPRYLFHPGRPFLGSYKAGERCEFTQLIELRPIWLTVTLSADPEGSGGAMLFERPTSAHSPHGPLRTRETPDRVDAQPLFGPTFDLVEDFRYDISTVQLDALVTELSRGQTRKFSLTTPAGKKSVLTFGGKLGKPFAAMFAACRRARFDAKESRSP